MTSYNLNYLIKDLPPNTVTVEVRASIYRFWDMGATIESITLHNHKSIKLNLHCEGMPLEKGMATHSSILAWTIQRTEDPGGLQSMGSQRAGLFENSHTHKVLRSLSSRHVGFVVAVLFVLPQMHLYLKVTAQSQDFLFCSTFILILYLLFFSIHFQGTRYLPLKKLL